ncbi:MAG: hypothetical protein LBJ00_14865 [Planctomycetaceae bacterium]|jgi:hypothetical protein|nr:hypothetical protein [Planctomycetaceae bacterium]
MKTRTRPVRDELLYTQATLKFLKLNTQAQQREAVVQGRSLSPYRLRYNGSVLATVIGSGTFPLQPVPTGRRLFFASFSTNSLFLRDIDNHILFKNP